MTSALDDPRVQPDVYIVQPTGYDAMVHSDKFHWRLYVVNGHQWGWAVRRYRDSPEAMNRKGKFIYESRGHGNNKARRYSLEEALQLALKYVDTLTVNGWTAQAAWERFCEKLVREGWGGDMVTYAHKDIGHAYYVQFDREIDRDSEFWYWDVRERNIHPELDDFTPDVVASGQVAGTLEEAIRDYESTFWVTHVIYEDKPLSELLGI